MRPMFNPGTAMNSSVITRVALTAAPVIAAAEAAEAEEAAAA